MNARTFRPPRRIPTTRLEAPSEVRLLDLSSEVPSVVVDAGIRTVPALSDRERAARFHDDRFVVDWAPPTR
ncbi:MAG TPA: hypothetical protein VGQ20_14240 [Acidimicrobiales bacterium]|jgi:hypothetical protein|nr:hypothetical protein [Acidimicrobiales bacterium]